jgi:hypothetical protein
MKTLRRTAGLLLALGLLTPAAQAGCATELMMRNGTIIESGPATHEARNGEFSFALPFAEQQVHFGSFDQRCFYAINIDEGGGHGHFSIEWVELDDPMDDAAFIAYWREFLPEYLRRNFGDGHYEIVATEEFVDAQGRRSLRYVGTGTNHGGGIGSIIGIASNVRAHRGGNMANVYTIFPRAVTAEDKPLESADAVAVATLSASLACSTSRCPKETPEP